MPTLDEDIFTIDDGNWHDEVLSGSISVSSGVKNYINTSGLFDQNGSYRLISPTSLIGMEQRIKFNTTTNAKIKVQIQDTSSFFHLLGFGAWIDDFGSGLSVGSSEKGSPDDVVVRDSSLGITDLYGTSVAISGDIMVVGAPGDDGPSNTVLNCGAAYVYKLFGSNWQLKQIIRASNLGADDNFGSSVSIDGNRIIIGSPNEQGPTDSLTSSGAAYVFITTDGGNTWTQEAILRASDLSNSSIFGTSVSISNVTVAIGAPGESAIASGSGAAYVFIHNGVSWVQQQKLKASNAGANDFFGKSVSISGDLLVSGAPSEDGSLDTLPSSGASYAFKRSAGVWAEKQILRASNADPLDSFGERVVINNSTIAVGAIGEDGPTNTTNQSGAVYIYVTTDGGNTWSQQQLIRASNTEAGDLFGSDVALYNDYLVVGAPGEDGIANAISNAGAMYFYSRSGLVWTEQEIKRPSGLEANDVLGYSVAIYGTSAIAGAIGDDGASNLTSASGAIYALYILQQSQFTVGTTIRPIVSSTTYTLIFTFQADGTIRLEILGGVYATPTLVATSHVATSGNYLSKPVRISINTAHSGT
jgi:photosystem II stability/assembly factor-like uncharacterized protein